MPAGDCPCRGDVLGIGLPARARAATFQPLNSPATTEHHPASSSGRSVHDRSRGRDQILQRPVRLDRQHNHPERQIVHGVQQRQPAGCRTCAAPTLEHEAALPLDRLHCGHQHAEGPEACGGSRGQVRADARDFPLRGTQAIIADNEGSTVGLLESTSGDSTDDEPAPGDWNWFELFVKQPQVVSDFYRRVIDYEIATTNAPNGSTIFCC